jgi:hypothetical protein
LFCYLRFFLYILLTHTSFLQPVDTFSHALDDFDQQEQQEFGGGFEDHQMDVGDDAGFFADTEADDRVSESPQPQSPKPSEASKRPQPSKKVRFNTFHRFSFLLLFSLISNHPYSALARLNRPPTTTLPLLPSPARTRIRFASRLARSFLRRLTTFPPTRDSVWVASFSVLGNVSNTSGAKRGRPTSGGKLKSFDVSTFSPFASHANFH